MKSSLDMYKPLRPSQILRSEEMVKNVVSILSDEYINPFGSDSDKYQLFNLSLSDRLLRKLVKFHDPIKRNDLPLFSSTNKSVQMKQNTRTKTVEINRNIVRMRMRKL